MPGEEPEIMETYQHEDGHDTIGGSEGHSPESAAGSAAKGAYATSGGETGYSAAAAAAGSAASSSDVPPTDDSGGHIPDPPHTGSGPWPDPPPQP
jgi:hypothetical protein